MDFLFLQLYCLLERQYAAIIFKEIIMPHQLSRERTVWSTSLIITRLWDILTNPNRAADGMHTNLLSLLCLRRPCKDTYLAQDPQSHWGCGKSLPRHPLYLLHLAHNPPLQSTLQATEFVFVSHSIMIIPNDSVGRLTSHIFSIILFYGTILVS